MALSPRGLLDARAGSARRRPRHDFAAVPHPLGGASFGARPRKLLWSNAVDGQRANRLPPRFRCAG